MASRPGMKSSLGSKSEIPSLPNKKVPQNPRYKNVGRKVDTGSSISSYMQKMEQMQACYKYKKDEIFKRIKCTTFSQLIMQVADDYYAQIETEELRPEIMPKEGDDVTSPPPIESSPTDTSERHTLIDLITGRGDLDSTEQPKLPSPESESSLPNHQQSLEIKDSPYLLLDVRESVDYEQCHITSAQNFPIANLSKSCNYFTREIFLYKNKPGKIIVLCDMDESIAPLAATLFIQKDVDNVFMLSGGMRVLYRTFYEGGFFSGILPDSILIPLPGEKVSPVKAYKGKKPSAPTLTAAQRDQGPHKPWFTEEDLTLLREQLDDRLIQNVSSCHSSQSSISRGPSSTGATSTRPSTKMSSVSNWKY
ncbi:Centrosomal protein of 41 kDa B [Oopsacas minuta]|uniref:Centrosomal protein of 41 kDa B n=1 Tax=Oopsacas minuta TaxID=111878 RepID=A0AAV7JRH7_9METZ|nr:Centrosomal protein of 41 kDa B [Oopsacas minuta]